VEIVLAFSTGLLVWWGASLVLHLPEKQAAGSLTGDKLPFFYISICYSGHFA
jgi:hypothetical protein